ncbi:MAG: biotin-dependent carboxyltransferase family protein [Coprothermobacterota bacterium]|nr:biotin-dependent carboxyltransferase family protein [Coprothermobacterota bacterium]
MKTPFLKVIHPGAMTLVQDLGRPGYLKYGLPPSGCADEISFRAGNALVGNQAGCAGLEMTVQGGKFQLLADTLLAITGADMKPRINGHPCPMWQSFLTRAGDILEFSFARSGCRSYLSVSGGIEVSFIMGSRATYLTASIGGLEGRPLQPGDILCRESGGEEEGKCFPPRFIPEFKETQELRVVLGPQDDHFTESGLKTFLSEEYTVTPQSNRMGYRLQGPPIETVKKGFISDAIALGAVQVSGEGQPIVLLWDRQTTGGYPKIGVVVKPDIWKLAQAKPGDKLRFRKVELEEARSLYRNYVHFLLILENLVK